MIIPDSDPIIKQGLETAVKSTYQFFVLVFPDITKERNLYMTDEQIISMYVLADSDEQFTETMAALWECDLEAEAVNLPASLLGEKPNE